MTAPEARLDTWTCGKCLVRYRVGEPAHSDEIEPLKCHCGLSFCCRQQPGSTVKLFVKAADLPIGACIVKGALP